MTNDPIFPCPAADLTSGHPGGGTEGPERTVLPGTAVVPGVVAGPAVRPVAGPVPTGADDAPLPEGARRAEAGRFAAAATRVAGRLAERAAGASGSTAAVLAAASAMAADRALRTTVEQLVASGIPVASATVRAVGQFEEAFTALGPPMAERVADLRDVRDRILAALADDPRRLDRTGTAVAAAELAVEYGLRDVDGRQPTSLRAEFERDTLLR
jgi:phosphoenolpyruvate-protein kinase (PTS system EI component)